jgi:DNA polymerase I
MSGDCEASSISWLREFDSVRHIDFEFRQDKNHCPVPVSLCAYEERTGTELFLTRDELLKLKRAPFGTGPRDLMIAYAANAEISCFQMLGWPQPRNVLDLYVEACAVLNGRTDLWDSKGRPGLVAVLELLGLPSISATEKQEMRDLILNNEDYSAEEWEAIKAYNRSDVEATCLLLPVLAPQFDLPHALHRGRYMAAVARQEVLGLPVNTDLLNRLIEHWQAIQLYYIARDDEFGLYEGTSFREEHLEALIIRKKWDWPRHPTGRLQLSSKVISQQAKRHPELRKLVKLRDTIAELRISKLVNTIGADGFSRCPMLPFWTRTSRCQPSARDKVFLPSLPAWLHGVLAPPKDHVLIELDWDAQEIAIMAAASGDENMIADYRNGDPHRSFGVRAGLIPDGADNADYQEVRNKQCKPVTLGSNYGMTPYGIAAKTGRSLEWARHIHAQHRQNYPTFHQWLGDMVAQAKFVRRLESPFGWPLHVIGDTRTRTLMNFPAQSGGADCMRIAAIAAAEEGIQVCCSVHDAFWILAHKDDADRTIKRMSEIMEQAGAAVTGGLPIRVSVSAVVPWPMCLGDVRGPKDKGAAMWAEVLGLIDAGLLRARG